MMCNQIFQTIGERTAKSEELDVKQYEVYLSMLVCYFESQPRRRLRLKHSDL